MYLSNTHSKRSVNMIFYKGLRCIRRNVFLAHREFFKMKPPPPFHLLIRLEIETIKWKEFHQSGALSRRYGEWALSCRVGWSCSARASKLLPCPTLTGALHPDIDTFYTWDPGRRSNLKQIRCCKTEVLPDCLVYPWWKHILIFTDASGHFGAPQGQCPRQHISELLPGGATRVNPRV